MPLETGRTVDIGAELWLRSATATERVAVKPEIEEDTTTKNSVRDRVFLVARSLFLVLLLVAVAAWAAQWIRTSVLYVHETDARVKAGIIPVSSTTDGVLSERLVNEGDRVTRGQVLAEPDSRAARLALAETRSALEAVQADMDRVDVQAEQMQAQVDSRIATARSQVGEAEASKRTFEDELSYLESAFQPTKALAESGTVPGARLERTRDDFLKARQELRKAEAGVQKAKALLDETIAHRAKLTVIRAERAVLAAKATELETRMQRQQIEIADRMIVSPIDGVVSGTFAMAGEYVSIGERLMVLHDPSKVWVETNIRETEIGRLAIGQPVRIEVDAYPDLDVEGTISRIGDAATSQNSLLPRLNESSTFTKVTQRIKVLFDTMQGDDRLKPRMTVEIYVDDGSAEGFWS